MTEMTPEKSEALRKAFPKSAIGKLPKGGMQLDYVGHAAVTDRLLSVDPLWTWEPFSVDEQGLPALDRAGNLWIRLTVCGHTRIGVGDGKSAKEAIGDALRNAAMRFGVALDLWSKEELESETPERPQRPAANSAPTSAAETQQETGELRTDAQSRHMFALLNEAGLGERDAARAHIAKIIGHNIESTKDLTKAEAHKVIEALKAAAKPAPENYRGEDPWAPR